MSTATIETDETMTARQIAKALGVGTRTRHYAMRDLEGYGISGTIGLDSFTAVLSALSRSDCFACDSDMATRVHTVAYALLKCISTGRMICGTSLRVQAYSPYRLCALVARIARECDETTIGGICDGWLIENHASL